jgi:hypothetical protein
MQSNVQEEMKLAEYLADHLRDWLSSIKLR